MCVCVFACYLIVLPRLTIEFIYIRKKIKWSSIYMTTCHRIGEKQGLYLT